MYGGAGGFGVRISQACVEVSDQYGIDYITDNKKVTMQNLNLRLETYLKTVSSLKEENAALELKINEFLKARAMPETACTAFKDDIHKLQQQVGAELLLRINLINSYDAGFQN